MKRKISLLLMIIVCSVNLILLNSCDKPPYNFTFINNSSHVVNVLNVKNADITSFDLAVNASKIVSIDAKKIEFQYSPANLVTSDIDTKKHKVTFTNK